LKRFTKHSRKWNGAGTFGFLVTLKEHELLTGREAIYIRYFLEDRNIFSDADLERYGKFYAAPEHLRAALEIYRSANEKFNAAQRSTASLPLMLAAGWLCP
jgi:hypothetical protein